MKCLDCGIESITNGQKTPKKRAAIQLVYEGVICKSCAGDSRIPNEAFT
jgi:hypothetical protein